MTFACCPMQRRVSICGTDMIHVCSKHIQQDLHDFQMSHASSHHQHCSTLGIAEDRMQELLLHTVHVALVMQIPAYPWNGSCSDSTTSVRIQQTSLQSFLEMPTTQGKCVFV